MFGFPLEVSKKLMKDLLSALKPTDRFNVMLFAGTSYMFSEASLYATPENIEVVVENLENKEGGGSTQLLPALKKAIELPLLKNGLSRSLVVVTDGYISVEKEAFELVRDNLNRANVFAFGIGSSTNRFLIEGLANVGQGLPFIIEKEELACETAERFKEYISTPSLSNITVDYEGFEAYDVEPRSIPDLMAERPINIIGKWKNTPKGKIVINGFFGGKKYTETINLSDYKPDNKNKALRLLWAREQLKVLDDYRKILYDADHKQEMIDLSLEYNLLSAYTSFVAVDYEKAHDGGQLIKKVKQALPLPEGVSNQAIGAEMAVKKVSKAKKSRYLKIGQLSGINAQEARMQLTRLFTLKLRLIKKCLASTVGDQLTITLKFDQAGILKDIEFNQELSEEVTLCLSNQIFNMDFSLINLEGRAQIEIPLEFTSSL
jgi:Ca-activated chloride channel family protein